MEKRPRVHIHFSLGSHGADTADRNIQLLEAQIRDVFSRESHVLNVFHSESANGSAAFVELARNQIASGRSYIDAISLALMFERNDPKTKDPKKTENYLANNRRIMLKEVPATGNNIRIVEDTHFLYVQAQKLDELADEFKFVFDSENHSKDDLEKMKQLERQEDFCERQALNSAYYRGDPKSTVDYFNKALFAEAEYLRYRNQSPIRNTQYWIEVAQWYGVPLRMVHRIGEGHDALVWDLANTEIKDPEYQPYISYTYDHGQPIRFPKFELSFRMQREPNFFPSYSESLRAFIAEGIREYLIGDNEWDPNSIAVVNRVLRVTTDSDIEQIIRQSPKQNPNDLAKKFFREKFGREI